MMAVRGIRLVDSDTGLCFNDACAGGTGNAFFRVEKPATGSAWHFTLLGEWGGSACCARIHAPGMGCSEGRI